MLITVGCPDKDCNEVVDVIIQSSDGKLFGGHSHRLALYSSGFLPPDVSAGGDAVVKVTEQGDVIEFLLRYFHPEHEFPDTMNIHFSLFDGLADAAEKYTVYSAIEITKLRMRLSVLTQPLQVLRYAVKHDYQELWQPAARQSLVSWSPRIAQEVFGNYDRLYSAWTSYGDQYAAVYNSITATRPEPNQHPGGSRKCSTWNRYVNQVQQEAARRRRSGELNNVDSFEETMHAIGEGRFDDCSCTDAAIGRWWNQVRLRYSKDFHYFYSGQA